MLNNGGAMFALAGAVIAVLAALEMITDDVTVWNLLSLAVGVVLFVWGLANGRRADRP